MNPGDFGFSVLASMLANKLDRLFSIKEHSEISNEVLCYDESEHVSSQDIPSLFKTFDAWFDLPDFLVSVRSPVISILVEDKPSTFYHLPTIVIESQETKEWFVFGRGRISFQGSGGGLHNSERIIEMLKAKNIPIGAWVVQQEKLDVLERGVALWPEIRSSAIPLLSFMAKDYPWIEILRNAEKLLKMPTKA
jgi:hypothetical protein